MSNTEEPEWVIAKQKSDRSFRNAALGVSLACLPVALVMMLSSQFEYLAAMGFAASMFLLISLACILMFRRTARGSLSRAFSTTLAALCFLAGAVTIAARLAHAS